MHEAKHIAIIGAGPAGLMAAETIAKKYSDTPEIQISIYDAKPSAGRKFLVAGKSGLNLTNGEDWQTFLTRYVGNNLPTDHWNHILNNFNNDDLRQWSASLGIETYVATSNKVFPINMKAAPLLRRWIEKLRALNIEFNFRHEFKSVTKQRVVTFESQGEEITKQFDAVVFALGGGSWAKTGSNGEWMEALIELGINTTPLSSANCGWEVAWNPSVLEESEGLPLKNIVVKAGSTERQGELVITKYGLEGGPIYRLGPAIKSLEEPEICIDLKPSFTEERLIAKMESAKRNLLKEAKIRWKLSPAAISILSSKQDWLSVPALAAEVKNCRIPLTRPRPLDEAISSSGGIQWSELDQNLMLKKIPGIYCAGEMLDWEAPTGGYLLQGCFATGHWVGKNLST